MKLNAFLVFCTSLWIAGAAGAQQEPAAPRAVDPTLVPYAHRSERSLYRMGVASTWSAWAGAAPSSC